MCWSAAGLFHINLLKHSGLCALVFHTRNNTLCDANGVLFCNVALMGALTYVNKYNSFCIGNVLEYFRQLCHQWLPRVVKIQQIVLPRTPLGSSRRSFIPRSWIERGYPLLVAWRSGRKLVFDRGTFLVLRSTHGWWVTTYVGKPSAIGHPTRPT